MDHLLHGGGEGSESFSAGVLKLASISNIFFNRSNLGAKALMGH